MNLLRKCVTVTSSLCFFFLCYFFLYQSILSTEDSSYILVYLVIAPLAVGCFCLSSCGDNTPLQLFTR